MGHTKKSKKEQTRTKVTKDTLMESLRQNMGNITLACHFTGCSRSTFYRYMETDENFKSEVEEISNIALDICEAELWKQIKDGNVPCILFYLKTKGKKRGYVERQELTGSDGSPVLFQETKTYLNAPITETDTSN